MAISLGIYPIFRQTHRLFPFLSIGAKVQCVGFASVASALHRSFAPDAKPGYVDRFHQGWQCGTSCDLSTLVQHIATRSWICLNHVFWISICPSLFSAWCLVFVIVWPVSGQCRLLDQGDQGKTGQSLEIWWDLFIVLCHKDFLRTSYDPQGSNMIYRYVIWRCDCPWINRNLNTFSKTRSGGSWKTRDLWKLRAWSRIRFTKAL